MLEDAFDFISSSFVYLSPRDWKNVLMMYYLSEEDAEELRQKLLESGWEEDDDGALVDYG